MLTPARKASFTRFVLIGAWVVMAGCQQDQQPKPPDVSRGDLQDVPAVLDANVRQIAISVPGMT